MNNDATQNRPRMNELVNAVDQFTAATGLKDSYLGKRAVGNSELIGRLRSGGQCLPATEQKLREFMRQRLEQLQEEEQG